MNQASCLCGKIGFTVNKFEAAIAHCHCKMCQKFHGAAFSTFAEVKAEHLSWQRGKEHLREYHADNGTVRQFCDCCGSSLIFESSYNRQAGSIEVALAAFDHLSEAIDIRAHLFVRSKASWYEITDQLPQYQQFSR